MNAISNFAFEENLVRVVDRDGEPWFVGKDICHALGLKNHNDALSDLDGDEKGVANIDPLSKTARGGGAQEVVIVSEPGVYRLVFRSRKPEAERFKRWLAHEVLPQIRKTGSYRAEIAEQPMTATQIEVRQALDMVRECRMIHGKQRAARLWDMLPVLPKVPEAPVLHRPGHESGRECLDHILSYRLESGEAVTDLLAEAMETGNVLDNRLRALGIRPVIEGEAGFAIATNPALTGGLFHETRWDKGRHIGALRSLPGVASFRHIKFQKNAPSSSIFIPAELLEEGCD